MSTTVQDPIQRGELLKMAAVCLAEGKPEEADAIFSCLGLHTNTGHISATIAKPAKPAETTAKAASKVQDKASKAKSSARAKSARAARKQASDRKVAMINGKPISFRQFSMLQTVRELVANGVNGAEGLSSTEIAEYRDCGEKGNDCSQLLDQLKKKGLVDWTLVDMKSGVVGPERFANSNRRRQFVLTNNQNSW
tara:strand:+ start:385 stop:969 length:585 start_codon:yes stop_codon:yes gene_type:complete